jgi:AcrR family transcriptional regulator
MSQADGILDKAGAALLSLSSTGDWRGISLREIAEKAGVDLADLYPLAPGKLALLAHLSLTFDKAALAAKAEGDLHDRLFEATMARVEAMEPHRAALVAISRVENFLAIVTHLPRTARAILEGAGVSASPIRLAAMTVVWARTVQVWRDDEGALNRTMAEIDLRLKQMRQRLNRVGAGF